MTLSADLTVIHSAAEALGLDYRGAFHPDPEDGVPAFGDGARAQTVVLLGFIGGRRWPTFAASPEYGDGAPEPLDRWSRRVIEELEVRTGGRGLYPSDGPPWLPFQRWACRSDAVSYSPLGILIHADFGLWHAYRGALAFRERLALPPPDRRPSPCEVCSAKPCLSACPIGAVTTGGYDHLRCRAHVAGAHGAACLDGGCLARRSCPVGNEFRYDGVQSSFHMAAFAGR